MLRAVFLLHVQFLFHFHRKKREHDLFGDFNSCTRFSIVWLIKTLVSGTQRYFKTPQAPSVSNQIVCVLRKDACTSSSAFAHWSSKTFEVVFVRGEKIEAWVWTELLITWIFQQIREHFSLFPSPLGNLLFQSGKGQDFERGAGPWSDSGCSALLEWQYPALLAWVLKMMIYFGKTVSTASTAKGGISCLGWEPSFHLWSKKSDLTFKQLSPPLPLDWQILSWGPHLLSSGEQEAWPPSSKLQVPCCGREGCQCGGPASESLMAHHWVFFHAGVLLSLYLGDKLRKLISGQNHQIDFLLFAAEFCFYQMQTNFAAKTYIISAEENMKEVIYRFYRVMCCCFYRVMCCSFLCFFVCKFFLPF